MDGKNTPNRRNPDPLSSVGKGEPEHEERTAMAFPTGHPESARLEARAAGELAPDEARLLDAHLVGCARCRAELEGWELLLAELGSLPAHAPTPGFAARVMEQVEVRPPLVRRLADRGYGILRSLGLLPGRGSRAAVPGLASGVRHLTSGGLQDYLDGLLAPTVTARVESHLVACSSCRQELDAWTGLVARIESLPPLAPMAGFSDRVMVQVQVAAVARVANHVRTRGSLAARTLAAAGRLLPSTRKGWALAGGVAIAPAIGLVAAAAAVVLHPFVSVSDLVTFLGWQAMDTAGAAGSWLTSTFLESALAYPLFEAARALVSASPAALAGGFTLGAALVATAGLVLYRNVIGPSLTGDTHVQSTS
jgi:anti-sigma factor RsiW